MRFVSDRSQPAGFPAAARRRGLPLLLSWLLIGAAFGGVAPAQEEIPEVARDTLAEADRHREAGRTAEAIAAYEEVLQVAPTVISAYVALGALYLSDGDPERALEVFRNGLDHDADHRDLLYNAAIVAMRLEQPERGLEYVERALAERSSRNDPALYNLQASILRRLDRSPEALDALERARKLSPGDARILFSLGNLYYELKRHEQAVDAYRRAVKRDRGMIRAHYNLGAVLFELDRYDEALDAYRVALAPVDEAFARGEEVPEIHAQAYLNLGAIYYRREEWNRAVDAYRKAIQLDPDEVGAHYNLGYIYFTLGMDAEALSAYERVRKIDPELPLAYFHPGQIHARQGDDAGVVRLLEPGLPHLEAADRQTAYLLLAEAHRELGQAGSAEAAYRQLLDAAPDHSRALFGLGSLLRRQGRLDEAGALLERAQRAAPEDPGLALELAAVARATGDFEGERTLYRSVLDRSRDPSMLWAVRLNLAILELRRGEAEAAQEQLEPLIPTLPSRVGDPGLDAGLARHITTLYALLLTQSGQEEEARSQLQTILRADAGFLPAVHALAALDTLGGHYHDAANGLSKILEEGGNGPSSEVGRELRGHLGLVLWRGTRSQEARRHLSAAAQSFPEWLEVQAALGEAYLEAGSFRSAMDHLTVTVQICDGQIPPTAAGRPLPPGHLRLNLAASPAARRQQCTDARSRLGVALVRGAYEEVSRSGSFTRARPWIDQALGLSLDPPHRALALYLRGTVQLLSGDVGQARRDLEAALAAGLPPGVEPAARNNLGVALYELERGRDARAQFEAARQEAAAPLGATLNLGIVLDEAQDNRQALSFYREYVSSGGARREEVAGWIDRLQRLTAQ